MIGQVSALHGCMAKQVNKQASVTCLILLKTCPTYIVTVSVAANKEKKNVNHLVVIV